MGMPKEAAQYVQEFEAKCSSNVCSALEWLEAELENGPCDCQFLVGKNLTAADIMMGFSVEAIFRMKLGTDENKWPQASKWLANVRSREPYKKAVQKTQYTL
jgi:glutathione S-transferase